MRYLIIDTANEKLTVAIVAANKILAVKSYFAARAHSHYILKELADLFNETGLEPKEIDELMVVNGPGSWTGMRIGVTVGRVYGWALNKKIIPVSSLHAAALAYSNYDYYAVCLDARRDYVYGAIYNHEYQIVKKESYLLLKSFSKEINKLQGEVLIISDLKLGKESKPFKLDLETLVKYYQKQEGITSDKLLPKYLKEMEISRNDSLYQTK